MNHPVVNGADLIECINKHSFSDMIFFLLKNVFPSEKESKMFEAILVSMIDHGPNTPSAVASRSSAVSDKMFNVAVANGVAAMDEHHGSTVGFSMKLFQDNIDKSASVVVDDLLSKGVRVPGYGHRIYNIDPRSVKLFEVAKSLSFFGKFCEFALDIEKSLEGKKNKVLKINVDGASAAILCDMGFDWRVGAAVFIVSRTPGICFQILNELKNQKIS